ncbi:STE3-domain-containing protein [Pluteus cervinus]|uniref:STE3-domain-containing protein n=1 Tax=Pluteus cervinus TaxID=181527 RepID=A0ACD3A8X3_9AGAR|nr:STE3-domain-containing protein [Pluteus cervinus]
MALLPVHYYPNGVFSAFSFMGFVLCMIPLPWHMEAWNTGTCLYMIWTGLGCLILFINSIVWYHNAINWSPIWCDIATKFIVGLSVAVPAASLCINRRLYHIASIRTVTTSKADKRRSIMVDLAIGLGIPIVEMILQYIPQGHRFNIYEDVGCWPFTYGTTVAVGLVLLPPILIGLVSGVYACLSIRAFWKSRSQFNEVLSSKGHRNLNSSRYVRLMCLASMEVLFTVPMSLYALGLNIKYSTILPWKGWAQTHKGFQRVDQYPSIIWKNSPGLVMELETSRWSVVACAFIFFAFFGFADEAFKNYRTVLRTVSKTIGLSTGSTDTFTVTDSKSRGFNGSSSIPSFVKRSTNGPKRADSIGSFSSREDKEKSFSPDLSYGALSLTDVGGFLADHSDSPYSDPSSGSSSASTSSISSPVGVEAPALPPVAVTRPESAIDNSPIRGQSPTLLTIPQISSRPSSPTRPVTPTHEPAAVDTEKANTPDMV